MLCAHFGAPLVANRSTVPAKAKEKSGKKLVIVESPAKSKSIAKYLGEGFEVDASVGHIRDLPQPSELPAELKKLC